jgi:uncharacterized protein involved in response to NO
VSAVAGTAWGLPRGLPAVLGDEGLRLFFPLAAVYAAVWPLLWVVVLGFDLPLARTMPPVVWHAREMLLGAFGAALIGFITTALPEWSDTPRLRGAPLFALAGTWAAGRAVGLLGADTLAPIGALADLAWLAALTAYVARVSWQHRTTDFLGFTAWLAALCAAAAAGGWAFAAGDPVFALQAGRLSGFVFLGLLALALAKISVPVTNLVLDPSEATSPFRPHPGRRNLAPGLIAVLIAGELAGLSVAATGYLMIAAGAAFLDRVGEAFIGRETFRAEIFALAGSSGFAGAGLLVAGAARLGAPWPESAGLHLAFMGGLGFGVLAVFAVAGLLHTGQPLRLGRGAKAALALACAATLARALPPLGLVPEFPVSLYAIAAVAWAGAFLVWLRAYWPLLADPLTLEARTC